MSAHTPGPWAVNPFNAQVDSAINGAPVPVCQMLWPTTLRTEDETEANANLIAAAPDLLEAAQETVGDFDPYDIRALASAALNRASLQGGQKEAIASVLQHFARGLRLNRAAIAKATGEQS